MGNRLVRGPFEAAVAFAGVVTFVVYLFDPVSARHLAVTSTARLLLPWWEALYGVGGLVILVGMLRLSLRFEVAGLLVLAAALVVNAISVFHFYGLESFAAFAVYAALAGAALLRVKFLLRAYRGRDDDEGA